MAQNVNLEFIERYQKLLQADPSSRVFAPLGEAYRKMGLLTEALRILKEGVKKHPHFPSGLVSLAKVLMEQQNYKEASEYLKKAVDLASENILAHRLLAESYMKLRQPKNALKSFKMSLFLNPNDAVAKEYVQKLESLTADEYEEEIFEMQPLSDKVSDPSSIKPTNLSPVIEKQLGHISPHPNPVLRDRQLERIVSLIDAFIARGDIMRASEVLKQGESKLGNHSEFDKRKKFIHSRVYSEPIEIEEPISPLETIKSNNLQKKIDFLERLLQRIQDRRLDHTLN